MHVAELLEASAPKSSSPPKKRPVVPEEVANSKFQVPKGGGPVLSGNILKKNRFYMQQERQF